MLDYQAKTRVAVGLERDKWNGDWRLCLDYRDPNRQMVSNAYLIPLLWNQLQAAAGNVWDVTLDCNWGFLNVPLTENRNRYTALITHMGKFAFNVLPFEVKNTPSDFQRAMYLTLSDFCYKGVYCSVDDIVIYGNTPDELLSLVEEVLKRRGGSGIYI